MDECLVCCCCPCICCPYCHMCPCECPLEDDQVVSWDEARQLTVGDHYRRLYDKVVAISNEIYASRLES